MTNKIQTRCRVTIVALTLLVPAACADPEPALPSSTDPDSVQATFTAPDGAEKLLAISRFDWPDGGAQAAEYFSWVGPDARSPDSNAAARAGQTAHVLANVLSDNSAELESIAPELLSAYETSLSPYQGAMVGDPTGVAGFGDPDEPADLGAARAVFDVMASNSETQRAFVDDAYAHALSLASSGAERVCADKSLASTVGAQAVASAAALFGLAGSVVEPPRDRPQSIDQVSHAMASACLNTVQQPPDGKIVEYLVDGRLISPEEALRRDGTLESYYQSLRDYIGLMGIDTGDYSELYDEAKGQ